MAVPVRESEVQKAIIEYLAAVCPGAVAWAVPNASRRTAGGKATNAVPGLRKGVFDLSVIFPGPMYVAIEVKTDKGELSDEQKLFRHRLIALGVPHCVAKSVEDVRVFLAQHHVQTREAA